MVVLFDESVLCVLYATLPYSHTTLHIHSCVYTRLIHYTILHTCSRIECFDDICAVGSECGNRRLQRGEQAETEIFQEFEMGLCCIHVYICEYIMLSNIHLYVCVYYIVSVIYIM